MWLLLQACYNGLRVGNERVAHYRHIFQSANTDGQKAPRVQLSWDFSLLLMARVQLSWDFSLLLMARIQLSWDFSLLLMARVQLSWESRALSAHLPKRQHGWSESTKSTAIMRFLTTVDGQSTAIMRESRIIGTSSKAPTRMVRKHQEYSYHEISHYCWWPEYSYHERVAHYRHIFQSANTDGQKAPRVQLSWDFSLLLMARVQLSWDFSLLLMAKQPWNTAIVDDSPTANNSPLGSSRPGVKQFLVTSPQPTPLRCRRPNSPGVQE